MSAGPPRVAVVGHVEWIDFAVVDRLPRPGEILHAREAFSLAAGGGAVAAVQLARLAGGCALFTALGDDAEGRAAREQLSASGVTVHAALRDHTRRGFTYLTDDHERTITILGERIVPQGDDPLPWDVFDAVYFTGGDVGALLEARRSRCLVASPRALGTLAAAGAPLDVLVASASDPGEAVPPDALDPAPRHVVLTRGAEGGECNGEAWAAAPLPGEPVDAYGCGDAFAAGLTWGLARGGSVPDAVGLGARCGAHALCGRGPYAGQLASA